MLAMIEEVQQQRVHPDIRKMANLSLACAFLGQQVPEPRAVGPSMFRDLMPSSFFARLRVFSAMPSAAGGCSPSLSPESVVHTRISRLLKQVWSRGQRHQRNGCGYV